MGVYLTPIIIKKDVELEDLKGKSFAVDANNYLYQFLALIRKFDGTPLKDSNGNITSHLAGLMFRTTRLILEYKLKMVFVFDGKPPMLKMRELEKRREIKHRATEEWMKALKVGDYEAAFSKAVVTSRLSQTMIDDAKRLLDLLGIPFVQAPSEAEVQAAYMASKGSVWACSSKDYDSLLFNTPKLVRYLTITGKEYLPSRKMFHPLKPELIVLDELLKYHGITLPQLVDLAILIGTDFNEGITGIGPKKALKLIKTYKKIENLPYEFASKLADNYNEVRKIFLESKVTEDYNVEYGSFREEELYNFLCNGRDFSIISVKTVISRMKKFYSEMGQTSLGKWLK